MQIVTGESLPQIRTAAPYNEEDVTHAHNILLAGTFMVSGEAKAVVFATGVHTEFGRIAQLTQMAERSLSPLQKEITRLSRLIAVLATTLGVIFFISGRAIGMSIWEDLFFAIGIIVANVPEGLLPTITLALAITTQRMAKRNALVRHLQAVETLGAATVICTDKTGTLTVNQMTAKALYFMDKDYLVSEIPFDEGIAESHRLFFETALMCHTLKWVEKNGETEVYGDPM